MFGNKILCSDDYFYLTGHNLCYKFEKCLLGIEWWYGESYNYNGIYSQNEVILWERGQIIISERGDREQNILYKDRSLGCLWPKNIIKT